MDKRILLAIILFVISGVIYAISLNKENATLETRQQEIHDKGVVVMPFDLDKTTHIFNTTEEGGIQQVRVKDQKDTDQIMLIREHLQMEQQVFSQGDFRDPKTLHGDDMPGLDVLQNNADSFKVEYSDLEDGGQLVYITDNQEVLNALHMWFMAQLMDHGHDATSEMMH